MLKKIIIFSFFALILGCVGLKASNAETISLCVELNMAILIEK